MGDRLFPISIGEGLHHHEVKQYHRHSRILKEDQVFQLAQTMEGLLFPPPIEGIICLGYCR